jgi:O-antigen/teichoic acid export membrane protein
VTRRDKAKVTPSLASEVAAGAEVQPDQATTMGRQHVRGSALLLFGRVAALVFTITTQVVVVRALSVTEFGSFAYALALVAAGRALLSLGQGKMISRFASIYEEERDYGRMFGSIVLAIGTVVVTSTVCLIAAFLLAGELSSSLGAPDATQVLLILLLLAPMEALDQVFISLFAVFSEPRSIFFRKYLLTPVLRLAVVLLLVAAGGTVTFLAVGYVVAQVIGLLVAAVLLWRILVDRGLTRHLRPRNLVLPVKAVFSFSIPTLTTELVLLSMTTGSVILLGVFWGLAEIAAYRAVWPAARLNQFVFSSFTTLFVPMAARLFARGDRLGMRETYWHTALFLAVFSFPIFAMTAIFSPATTVTLFGERYAGSAAVLSLLAIGYYFNVALGFNSYTLIVYGRLRYLIVVNVSAAALNLVLGLLLIPHYGAVGVAVANCATLIAQNMLNQVALARAIGSGVLARDYVWPYVAVVVAAMSLVVAQATLSPGLLESVALTVFVSAALLLVTRKRLHLADTFPELRRVPLLGRLLA